MRLELNASRSESTDSSNSLCQFFEADFNNVGVQDLFDEKLSDAFTSLDIEIGLTKVEEQNLDFAAIVFVNNACSNVDEILDCESGTRCNASIVSTWNRHREASADKSLSFSRNCDVFAADQIHSSRQFGRVDWQLSVLVEASKADSILFGFHFQSRSSRV